MPSSFAWVDFDETSRRKMLDVIDMFRDQNTVDELGIGTIRDAFADYLFPGTSTIQTRARYFLFIPWIYQRLEMREIPSVEIASAARKAEVKLIEALINSGVGENEGIIGKRSREKLQRLPSNIYWVGLSRWGIRMFPGTQDQYYRYLDQYYRRKRNKLLTDDLEPIDSHREFNWDPHIPDPPDHFPEGATMDLRRNEARYLQDKIAENHGESLLATLINTPNLFVAEYFWENEQLMKGLPDPLKDNICHARDFAQTLQGAVLIYNLMLAEAQKNEGLLNSYRSDIETWVSGIRERYAQLSNWHASKQIFWGCAPIDLANISQPTRQFVESWWSLIFKKEGIGRIHENPEARDLIRQREVRLKKNRSRLENSRYLELWNGYSGAAMMDYRWRIVSVIVRDIRRGLGLECHNNSGNLH